MEFIASYNFENLSEKTKQKIKLNQNWISYPTPIWPNDEISMPIIKREGLEIDSQKHFKITELSHIIVERRVLIKIFLPSLNASALKSSPIPTPLLISTPDSGNLTFSPLISYQDLDSDSFILTYSINLDELEDEIIIGCNTDDCTNSSEIIKRIEIHSEKRNLATCGNGLRETGEECDDGNTNLYDGCFYNCSIEDHSTCTGGSPTTQDTCTTTCGNGVRDGIEECDDGNRDRYDGCSWDCKIEDHSTCTGGSATTIDTCVNTCGNGLLDGTEECDDGNTKYYDGCKAYCIIESGGRHNCVQTSPTSPTVCTATCGDSRKPNNEDCDDGNTVSGDGCSSTCVEEPGYYCTGGSWSDPDTCISICGDGLRVGTEECDDDDTADGDGCSSTCTVETGFTCTGGSSTSEDTCTGICGDGKKMGTEACDDNNTTPGDGCSATCTVETGYSCSGGTPTTPDTCSITCGDGFRAGTENCDDGDTTSGDGCGSICTVETGFTCTGGSPTSADTCNGICGDGLKVGNEECDDNDTYNGDGCSSSCTIEDGYTCTGGSPSASDTCSTTCGDGFRAGSEACDDGDTTGGDGCSSSCAIESGFTCTGGSPTSADTCGGVCGDGLKITGEQCDDGDLDNGDGCSSTCTIEDGYTCTGGSTSAADTCSTTCGDGFRAGTEGCDDSDTTDGDGCSSTCAVESGYACSGGTPTTADTCSEVCGDGLKAGSELCEDGNLSPGDGCSATCTIETGYDCTGGSITTPDTCTPICGDSKRIGNEECDDTNAVAGDGCSDACTVEIGYTCTGGTPTTPDSCSGICGDGIKVSVEPCDDGNTDDGDGCDATCTTIEDDYDCTGGSLIQPDTCEVVCGNGIMFDTNDPTKYCDDNNTNSGDGCNSNCQVETDWICTGGSITTVTTCNLCELEHCITCEAQDHTKCTACEGGYKVGVDLLCTKTAEVLMSSSAKAIASSSQFASNAGSLAALLSSLLRLSSPVAIWAIVHQMQLMGLFILTRVYIPDDPKGLLIGKGSNLPFSMSSIPTHKLPGLVGFSNLVNFNQTNAELESIGLESGSPLLNNLTMFLTIILVMILHPLIFCIPKFDIIDSSQKCKIISNKVAKLVVNFFTFTIYIRTIYESFQYSLLSTLTTVKKMEFDTPLDKISMLFSLAIIFMCCCFLQFSLYVAFLSFSPDHQESEKGKEFLIGIKNSKMAKLYSFFALLRRLLFCFWLVFFVSFGAQVLIIGVLVIHAPFVIYLIVIRPFEDPTNNMVEIVNELFLTVVTVWLCFINEKSQWSEILSKILTNILFSNTIMVSLITLTSCLIMGCKLCKKKCSSKLTPKPTLTKPEPFRQPQPPQDSTILSGMSRANLADFVVENGNAKKFKKELENRRVEETKFRE